MAPHTVDRTGGDFSAASQLLRIFLDVFTQTLAVRERVADPKPKLLTAEGEGKFIGLHGKRLNELAGGVVVKGTDEGSAFYLQRVRPTGIVHGACEACWGPHDACGR